MNSTWARAWKVGLKDDVIFKHWLHTVTVTATFHLSFSHFSSSALKVKDDWTLLTPVGITCSLILSLFNGKSLQWLSFFLSRVSVLRLWSWFYIHTTLCIGQSLCRTVFSHLSVSLLLQERSWLDTDSPNLTLARTHADSYNTCIYRHTWILTYLCQTCRCFTFALYSALEQQPP